MSEQASWRYEHMTNRLGLEALDENTVEERDERLDGLESSGGGLATTSDRHSRHILSTDEPL
jgi:hypothetical protein